MGERILLLTGAPEGWDDDIDGGPIAPLSGNTLPKI